MSEQTLESEVEMRRVYGILLYAEEDESVREFVYIKLLSTDRCFEELVKNPNRTNVHEFVVRMGKYKAKTHRGTNAPMFFLAYLFYVKLGLDTDNRAVKGYLERTHELFLDIATRKEEYINIIHEREPDGIVLPKKMRPIIRSLRGGFDINSFTEFFSSIKMENGCAITKPALYHDIKTYSDSGNEESVDTFNAYKIADMANVIMQTVGVNFDEICGCVDITKDEQNTIMKIIAKNHVYLESIVTCKVDVAYYLIGHIFMIMAKETRNMKEFYFRNNSETQFLELQRLESVVEEKELEIASKDLEIEHLKAELANADERNERQRDEIARLMDEVAYEDKEAVKPYVSEIAELNSRIRELEKNLEAEKAKNPELNALREFAFASQTEYVPPETSVTLAELLRSRKVIIVGGHINWRHRLKTKHPTIEFLDGHSVSLDVSIFDKADFTLLNTANMSHTLYYKVIDYLRGKNAKFDYLGRSTNQDLLEAEIISILQEKNVK